MSVFEDTKGYKGLTEVLKSANPLLVSPSGTTALQQWLQWLPE
jgi:hypothetical protein